MCICKESKENINVLLLALLFCFIIITFEISNNSIGIVLVDFGSVSGFSIISFDLLGDYLHENIQSMYL